MSNEFDRYYKHACEYTVPIKLNVPIFIEPHVLIKPCISPVDYKIPVNLEPEIALKPEVKAAPAKCLPQNGHHDYSYQQEQLPAYE